MCGVSSFLHSSCKQVVRVATCNFRRCNVCQRTLSLGKTQLQLVAFVGNGFMLAFAFLDVLKERVVDFSEICSLIGPFFGLLQQLAIVLLGLDKCVVRGRNFLSLLLKLLFEVVNSIFVDVEVGVGGIKLHLRAVGCGVEDLLVLLVGVEDLLLLITDLLVRFIDLTSHFAQVFELLFIACVAVLEACAVLFVALLKDSHLLFDHALVLFEIIKSLHHLLYVLVLDPGVTVACRWHFNCRIFACFRLFVLRRVFLLFTLRRILRHDVGAAKLIERVAGDLLGETCTLQIFFQLLAGSFLVIDFALEPHYRLLEIVECGLCLGV